MQVVASVFVFFALGVNTAILLAVAVTALRWAAEPSRLLGEVEDVAADTADERLIAWLKQLEEIEPPPGWEERAVQRWREQVERSRRIRGRSS